jgi:hypothetical protein
VLYIVQGNLLLKGETIMSWEGLLYYLLMTVAGLVAGLGSYFMQPSREFYAEHKYKKSFTFSWLFGTLLILLCAAVDGLGGAESCIIRGHDIILVLRIYAGVIGGIGVLLIIGGARRAVQAYREEKNQEARKGATS